MLRILRFLGFLVSDIPSKLHHSWLPRSFPSTEAPNKSTTTLKCVEQPLVSSKNAHCLAAIHWMTIAILTLLVSECNVIGLISFTEAYGGNPFYSKSKDVDIKDQGFIYKKHNSDGRLTSDINWRLISITPLVEFKSVLLSGHVFWTVPGPWLTLRHVVNCVTNHLPAAFHFCVQCGGRLCVNSKVASDGRFALKQAIYSWRKHILETSTHRLIDTI